MHREPVDDDDHGAWPPGVKDTEGRCIVMKGSTAWVVPMDGVLKMRVSFERAPTSSEYATTPDGFGNLVEVRLGLAIPGGSNPHSVLLLLPCR